MASFQVLEMSILKGHRYCSIFTQAGDYKHDNADSTDQAALASLSSHPDAIFCVHATWTNFAEPENENSS